MKTPTFSAALLFGASLFAASVAQAGNVVCADGTIYHLTGDEITGSVACARHGGLSATQVPGANEIQTSTPMPPIEDGRRPTPLEIAKRILEQGGSDSDDGQTGNSGRLY